MAAKIVPFEMVGDVNNQRSTLTLRAPQYIDARVLAANVAETHTVPSTARFVVFSATADFYVDFIGGTAAVPSADVTNGTAPFLNPASLLLSGITSLSIVAAATCILTMAFYK